MSDGDGYLGFVGVSTGGSSILRVFPEWARLLGLPTRRLRGHDVPLDAPEAAYRAVIGAIRSDPQCWGALVTTHKMAVYAAAADLFDDVDDLARTFREISSVAKRGPRLTGAAKDPVTVRLALEELLPARHFADSGAAALVLGSGGAGSALSHALATRADPPAEVICTALTQPPLDHLRELHERAGTGAGRVRYVVTADAGQADHLLHRLPPGSLVANATGMGKDRPGSPLGDAAVFPDRAYAWDFNYRGTLEFLRQARRQQEARRLVVADGWRYFVYGWTQVIADVFDRPISPDELGQLSAVAAGMR